MPNCKFVVQNGHHTEVVFLERVAGTTFNVIVL